MAVTKRILIVEDDPEMKLIYERFFQSAEDKYRIMIVNDARVAFKKLGESEFDLVILDVIMEPMDGESFFACVREDDKRKDVPVLVVSVINPLDIEHFKRLGNVDFLRKPITETQLFQKIKKLTGQ